MGSDSKRIGQALGRLFVAGRGDGGRGRPRPTPDPACEFGLVVEERLGEMAKDIRETRDMLKWLLRIGVGLLVTVIADLAVRLLS